MSRIKRPYIPMSVRVEVAERDLSLYEKEKGVWWLFYFNAVHSKMPLGKRLAHLLERMPKGAELDHCPALVLRKFSERTGKYTPDANDPLYLEYRAPDEHQQKTTGRRPGARNTITTKGSDVGLKTKFAKLARKGKHRVSKIASRPFSKQKRSFR